MSLAQNEDMGEQEPQWLFTCDCGNKITLTPTCIFHACECKWNLIAWVPKPLQDYWRAKKGMPIKVIPEDLVSGLPHIEK
jgi:hypothetical protein